jgi:hypothetical protein
MRALSMLAVMALAIGGCTPPPTQAVWTDPDALLGQLADKNYAVVQSAIFEMLQSGDLKLIDTLVAKGLKDHRLTEPATRAQMNTATEMQVRVICLVVLCQKVPALDFEEIFLRRHAGAPPDRHRTRVLLELGEVKVKGLAPKTHPVLDIPDLTEGELNLLCEPPSADADLKGDFKNLKGDWIAAEWGRIRLFVFVQETWPPVSPETGETFPAATRCVYVDADAMRCGIPRADWVVLSSWERLNRTYAARTGVPWEDWLALTVEDRRLRLEAHYAEADIRVFSQWDRQKRAEAIEQAMKRRGSINAPDWPELKPPPAPKEKKK